MGNIESNKAICRKFHVSIMEGKFDEATRLLADDVVWWVQGDMPVSGYHYGRDAVTKLLEPLRALPNGIAFTFGEVTAEADRVSVEMRAVANIAEGVNYDNTYHFLFTVRDGLIASCKEYLDTKLTSDILFRN